MQRYAHTGRGSRRLRPILVALAATALCSVTLPVNAQDAPPRGERPGVRGGQDGDRPGRGRPGGFEGRGDRGRDDGGRFGRGGRMGRGGFGGPGGMMAFMQPELLRRDLRLISNELDLDDDQDAVLETLLLDYDAAFDDASDAIRAKFMEMRPDRDAQVDEETRAKRDAIREEIRTIREEFRELRRGGDGEEPDPAAIEAARAKMQSIRERMQELRPPRPEGAELEALIDNMSGLAAEWQRTRDRLRNEFMTSLQAILSDEQAAGWPAFEMTFRRQKTIDQGQLSGESVDLIALVRGLDLTDDQVWQIRPALDAYALSIDRALAAREEHLATARLEMMQAMMSRDADVVTQVVENEMKHRTAVRDVNLEHAALLAGQLAADVDEAVAREFGEAWRERAYQRIWRTGTTQRSFEVAREIEDVDEDTLEAIVALEGSYLIELYGINERLEQLTRQHEPGQRITRMRWVSERMRDGDWGNREGRPEDPIDETFRERSDLDGRYREMLEALLTPEQIELLPAPRRGRGDGRWGGPGSGQRGDRGDRGDDGERRQRMIERFDTDGDGELSDVERRNAREQRRGGPRGGGGGGGGGDPA